MRAVPPCRSPLPHTDYPRPLLDQSQSNRLEPKEHRPDDDAHGDDEGDDDDDGNEDAEEESDDADDDREDVGISRMETCKRGTCDDR